MNSKPQTPLEKLTAEKNRVRELTKEQEVKINGHIAYVQANAGSLLLSSLSSMLFKSPSTKEAQSSPDSVGEKTDEALSGSLSFADILPLGKALLPVAWDVARPILISWGIKKAGSIVTGLFSRKKVKL